MKSVAGVSNVFTAININTGQKMAVRIPPVPASTQPAGGKQSAITVTRALTQSSASQNTLIKNVISVSDVHNAAASKLKPVVLTPSNVVAPVSLQLQLSPEVANNANKIAPGGVQLIKLNVGKKDLLTAGGQQPTVSQQKISTVGNTPLSNVVSAIPTSQPQTVILGSAPSTGTGSTSPASQQPLIFTIVPSSSNVSSTTSTLANTASSQLTGKAGPVAQQPIQLILSPGSKGQQNITITVPSGAKTKTDGQNTTKPLSQRIGGTSNALTPAKVSTVLPMQRFGGVVGEVKKVGTSTVLEPQKLNIGKVAPSAIVTKTATATQSSTLAKGNVLSVCGAGNSNIAKVNPVVPISISAVQALSDQDGRQQGNDPTKGEDKRGSLQGTEPAQENVDEQQNPADSKGGAPMFKIDSVFTLSETSAKELFPEEGAVKVKIEKQDPDAKSPKSDVPSQLDLWKIRVKEEPPDTGYDKAMHGNSAKTSSSNSEKTPPTSTAATAAGHTKAVSEIVNRCAEVIAKNEKTLSASSTSAPGRENATSHKQYVLVTKQDIIPPTPSAITIQKTTSPNTMLVTPVSSLRKPGEPMKWNVVAPPTTPQTSKPESETSTDEKTIVVHSPGTAMKATRTGVSTYIVKNPTGKTKVLQIKSAAAQLSEMASIAGNSEKPAHIVYMTKPGSKLPASTQTTKLSPVVKTEPLIQTKGKASLVEVTAPLAAATKTTDFNSLTPVVSLLRVTTSSTATPTISTSTSGKITATTASSASTTTTPSAVAGSRMTRQSARVAQVKNSEIMTRKRKQDLRALSEKHQADKAESSPAESPAKRAKESVQDERIRKLKKLLKEREAALEQVRQMRKSRHSEDEDDT
ncbi:mucin-2-like isoform X2 [Ptychodera flava]